jgi:prevent-host-death family protein
MKTVNIGALKNNLSSYLRDVRNGEEVLVKDRDKPIARILPIRAEQFTEEELHLASIGVITLPENPNGIDWEKLRKLPMPEVSEGAVQEAMDWVRGER